MPISPEEIKLLNSLNLDPELLAKAVDYKTGWNIAIDQAQERIANFVPEYVILSGASAPISSLFLGLLEIDTQPFHTINFSSAENWWIYKRFWGQLNPMRSFIARPDRTSKQASEKVLDVLPDLPSQVQQKFSVMNENRPNRILILDDYRSIHSYKAKQFPLRFRSNLEYRPVIESLFITGEKPLEDVLYFELLFFQFIKNWAKILSFIDPFLETFGLGGSPDTKEVLTDLHNQASDILGQKN